MIPLYKFPRTAVDREKLREESFARAHIAQRGAEDFAHQDFWPLMERYLKQGKQYIDVQSGTGGWALFLHDEGFAVEAVDPSRRVAQAISEYSPVIPVHMARPTQLPYAGGRFDGVVAIGALEALQHEVPSALREWRRVLREDGTLFFQVPYANPLRRLLYLPLKRLEYRLKRSLGQMPVFAGYLFTPRELHRLTREAGFAIVELVPHELPGAHEHFGLYHDWKWLRGDQPYRLNAFGRMVKQLCAGISPWLASTGVFAIAKTVPPTAERHPEADGRRISDSSRSFRITSGSDSSRSIP